MGKVCLMLGKQGWCPGSFCPLRFRDVELAGRWIRRAQICCSSCSHIAEPLWPVKLPDSTSSCSVLHQSKSHGAEGQQAGVESINSSLGQLLCALRWIWSCWPEIRQRLHFLEFIVESSLSASHSHLAFFTPEAHRVLWIRNVALEEHSRIPAAPCPAFKPMPPL